MRRKRGFADDKPIVGTTLEYWKKVPKGIDFYGRFAGERPIFASFEERFWRVVRTDKINVAMLLVVDVGVMLIREETT